MDHYHTIKGNTADPVGTEYPQGDGCVVRLEKMPGPPHDCPTCGYSHGSTIAAYVWIKADGEAVQSSATRS